VARRELIIKDTHRGLLYKDGVVVEVLAAGRHVIPRHIDWRFFRNPLVQTVLVDVRQRDLTIKGQEILTADKVAIRVSIIVQFRVTDLRAEPGWGVLVYPAGLAHRDFVSNLQFRRKPAGRHQCLGRR